MAGIIQRAVPMRVFDFSNIAVGATHTYTVASRIDISQYIDCVVEVRTHAADFQGGIIWFDLYGDGYTEEDPRLNFTTTTPLFSSVIAAPAPGFFLDGKDLRTYGGQVLGRYASLVVSGNRTIANTLRATLSVDLVLRTTDD